MSGQWWTARLLHQTRFPDYTGEFEDPLTALDTALAEDGEDVLYPLYAEVRELREIQLSECFDVGALWSQLFEHLLLVSQFTDIEATDFPVGKDDFTSLRWLVKEALDEWVNEMRSDAKWPLVLDFTDDPAAVWCKETESGDWKPA
jgi:hypothetical protein